MQHTHTDTHLDPVCGMTVKPERSAGSHEHRGTSYYFCGKSCLEKFKNDPAKYLKPIPEPITEEAARAEYTCPMHPEVRQFWPSACPKCGMALEPVTFTGEESTAELDDMTRRFWISAALSIPILAIMISELLPGKPLHSWLGGTMVAWIQFVLKVRPSCSGLDGHSSKGAGRRSGIEA